MVSPSDTSLVSESGDDRRRFVNSVLSQMDREYLAAMQQYNRFLFQRNKVLKDGTFDESLLDVFDERMNEYAGVLHGKRDAFVKDLLPLVAEHYATLSGGRETVSIDYRSDLRKGSLVELLKASREKDRIFIYSTAGIQRDDFLFEMNGFPIRRCGSQGQQKSFLVSLKFAQYELMKRRYGFPPMLLLDDVFDKLDMSRISNLLGMVAGSDFGQIIITASTKTLRKFYRAGKLYVTISPAMLRSHLESQKPALVQAMNRFLEKDELFVKDYDKVGFVKELILK